jgi:hypothetical protein
MYRTLQFPGGALTLLGVVVLSFLVPGLTASAIGLSAFHAQLLAWILSQHGLPWLVLLLLYGMSGFALLLGALMAAYTACLSLIRALAEVKDWARETSLSLATLLGELIAWPLQVGADQLRERFDSVAQHFAEQRQMRQIYREDYADEFRTYADFLRFWRGLSDEPAETTPDPLPQAIRLMGLPADFSRDDLKRRFHTLIDRIHPDKVGPNELATQLIDAYKLINQRKGWKK